MTSDRDEETGRYTLEFPIWKFKEALESREQKTTSKVAEHVGCSYALAYRRLKELEAEGEVDSTKVGDTYLWFLAE